MPISNIKLTGRDDYRYLHYAALFKGLTCRSDKSRRCNSNEKDPRAALTHRVESSGQRLSGVGRERNKTTLHTAEIAVASHRAAKIE